MDKRPRDQNINDMSLEAPQPEVSAEPAAMQAAAGVSVGASSETKAIDHASVRLALAGDERGFAELYQRYERRAWRVARNLVPSDDDAQDLVQDAFMRVFKSLERFDFSHAFSTWLYRIVTNLAIDHLRKRRPTFSTTGPEEDEADPELIDESAPDPSEQILRGETVEEVRACLDALAPHFQSALVLRELEGLPCNEIAEIVGATHVTVRWRLHRGRKLFQEEWERREREREFQVRSNVESPDFVHESAGEGGLEASPHPQADGLGAETRAGRGPGRESAEKTGPEE
jgi:RNA polymerase sigma-70 factor (ECF subfamily)